MQLSQKQCEMVFRIGTRRYPVIMRRELYVGGKKALGACGRRIIWLDPDASDESLVHTLRHEHVHAWEFEVGAPEGVEGRANFGATVGAAFDEEFNAQGGVATLRELPIESGREATTDYADKIMDRIQLLWDEISAFNDQIRNKILDVAQFAAHEARGEIVDLWQLGKAASLDDQRNLPELISDEVGTMNLNPRDGAMLAIAMLADRTDWSSHQICLALQDPEYAAELGVPARTRQRVVDWAAGVMLLARMFRRILE